MLTFLLTRPPAKELPAKGAPRFYRVAVEYNLFGEYSVTREWGQRGTTGTRLLVWFSNLREACIAAEHWRKRATRRGYNS